jgi:hypothetical protein
MYTSETIINSSLTAAISIPSEFQTFPIIISISKKSTDNGEFSYKLIKQGEEDNEDGFISVLEENINLENIIITDKTVLLLRTSSINDLKIYVNIYFFDKKDEINIQMNNNMETYGQTGGYMSDLNLNNRFNGRRLGANEHPTFANVEDNSSSNKKDWWKEPKNMFIIIIVIIVLVLLFKSIYSPAKGKHTFL